MDDDRAQQVASQSTGIGVPLLLSCHLHCFALHCMPPCPSLALLASAMLMHPVLLHAYQGCLGSYYKLLFGDMSEILFIQDHIMDFTNFGWLPWPTGSFNILAAWISALHICRLFRGTLEISLLSEPEKFLLDQSTIPPPLLNISQVNNFTELHNDQGKQKLWSIKKQKYQQKQEMRSG